MIGEIRIKDPKTGGEKGAKPEDHDQIPVRPLDELARVYSFGMKKYARGNYLKGYAWSLSTSAMLRHIHAFRRGESRDPESGLHHLAHAAFHLFALMEYERRGLGTDDRLFVEREPKRGRKPAKRTGRTFRDTDKFGDSCSAGDGCHTACRCGCDDPSCDCHDRRRR